MFLCNLSKASSVNFEQNMRMIILLPIRSRAHKPYRIGSSGLKFSNAG